MPEEPSKAPKLTMQRLVEPDTRPFKIIIDNTAPVDEETVTVIHGSTGVGKTTIGMQWYDHNKPGLPLLVSFRGGGEHRAFRWFAAGMPVIEIFSIEQWNQVTLKYTKEGLPVVKGHKIQTIVVDQLPSAYRMFTEDVLVNVSRARDNAETMAVQDIGQNRHRMHQMFINLSHLPCHKLYLSLSMESGKGKGKVNLIGQLADEVPGFATFVFHMDVRKQNVKLPGGGNTIKRTRILQTQADQDYVAKDATGLLPDTIDVPDENFPAFNEILAYLRKEKVRNG